jgi:hypothetical protein
VSRFHGRVGKGAARVARELRREEAQARAAAVKLEHTRAYRTNVLPRALRMPDSAS